MVCMWGGKTPISKPSQEPREVGQTTAKGTKKEGRG